LEIQQSITSLATVCRRFSVTRQQKKPLAQLKVLGVFKVFVACAGDAIDVRRAWMQLHRVVLAGNAVTVMDDSLQLLPVVKVLDLSDNDLAGITGDLKYV
jgi:hypothetical protein